MPQTAMTFIYKNTPSEQYGLYIGELGSNSEGEGKSSTFLEIIYDKASNRCENFIYGIVKKHDMMR